MSQNKFDLFDIEKIINIMEEKNIADNYILFKTNIPHIDNYGFINIKLGESSCSPVNSNYFLTFGILHEFLQEYNNINKNTFKYFSKNILERKELNIDKLAEKIAMEENININDIKKFDFSHKKFFINDEHFSKGSYIKNITYCYNNNEIYMKLLEIFLIQKISKKHKFLIKLPSIINKTILDIIKLLAYIFQTNIIFKNVHDSYFKDSFHIFLENIIPERYYEIQKKIKKNIYYKKIDDKQKIKQILDLDYNNIYTNFEYIIKEFSICIEIVIFTFLLSLQQALNHDKKETYRRDKNWTLLDYYNNYLK